MPLDLRGLCPLFQVYDMPASLRFYRDVLGFKVHQSSAAPDVDNADWVWLKRGTIELMLNTRYESDDRPPNPDPHRIAAHHDTCLYIGCPDIDGAYLKLRALGVTLEPPKVAPYGMKQLSFKDPDGFGICLQWSVSG